MASKTQQKFNQIFLNSDDFQQGAGVTDLGQVQLKYIGPATALGSQTESLNIAVDTKGRVTGLSVNDITLNPVNTFAAADDSLDLGSQLLINVAEGSDPTDGVNLGQMNDAITVALSDKINSLSWKAPSVAKQASGDLGAADTYFWDSANNKITFDKASYDGLTFDGVKLELGDRVILDDLEVEDADPSQPDRPLLQACGIYEVITDGSALYPCGEITVLDHTGIARGRRSRAILSLIDTNNIIPNDQPEDEKTVIKIYDFSNAEHTFDLIPALVGQPDQDVLDYLAKNIASKEDAEGPLFYVQQVGNTLHIHHNASTRQRLPEGHSGLIIEQKADTNPAFQIEGESEADFTDSEDGDTITFRNQANTEDVVFEFVQRNATDPQVNPRAGQVGIADGAILAEVHKLLAATLSHSHWRDTLFSDIRPGEGGLIRVCYKVAGALGNDNVITSSMPDNVIGLVDFSGGADTVNSVLKRAEDMDEQDEFAAAASIVERGNTFADQGFVCTVDNNSYRLNQTAVQWIRFTGLGMISAGIGISKTSDRLDIEMVRIDDTIITAQEEQHDFGVSASYDAAYWNALQAHPSTMVFLNGALLEPASAQDKLYTAAAAAGEDGDYWIEYLGKSGDTMIYLAEDFAVAGDKITIIFAAQTPLT